MCGCEAHHAKGKLCNCICSPRDHADPIDVIRQRQDVLLGRKPVPGGGALWPDGREPAEKVEPGWAKALGLHFHSDDDSIMVRDLYSHQVNSPEGYVVDELTLSHQWWSWALSVEFERPESDLSGHQYFGVTLRVGPFSLTASRQRGRA